MSDNTEHGAAVLDPAPIWWVSPDQTDWFAWGGIAAFALAGYVIMTLYARFDKWAEHKSHGTPLAKTIPTLLTIALLYEVFPLDHFHALLPITAILLALMADWMHAQEKKEEVALGSAAPETQTDNPAQMVAEPEPTDSGSSEETVTTEKQEGETNV